MSKVSAREFAQSAVEQAAGLKHARTEAVRRGTAKGFLTIAFPHIVLMVDEPRECLNAEGWKNFGIAAGLGAMGSRMGREGLAGPGDGQPGFLKTWKTSDQCLKPFRVTERIERDAVQPHRTCKGFAGRGIRNPADFMVTA